MRASVRHLALIVAGAALGCTGAPRGDCDPDPAPGAVGSVCGFRNPEDVAFVPSAGLLLVSQMRHGRAAEAGSLAALTIGAGGEALGPPRRLWPRPGAAPRADAGGPSGAECPGPPDAAIFSPHGIAAGAPAEDGAVSVAVVAHGGREAVERFELVGRGEAAQLRWRGCVPLPPDSSGNDVALGAGGVLAVTDYQPVPGGAIGFYYAVKGGLGGTTGEVLAWRPGRGWRSVPGTEGANPNGIVLSRDGATLYHAQTGGGSVQASAFEPLAGAPPSHRTVSIGGHPDNLSWSPRGTILAMTHTEGPSVLLCRLGRLPCRTAWALFEIDPRTLRAEQRLRHDGSAVGAASSVAEARGRFYFGAVFDDRIGVWRPRPDRGR